ncbi:transcriptional regulator [Actinomadura rubrobrunea]|uniref:Transcriptional regulator n=1 Tax=Actinomadura rubrobrunea TaxID=115335 RepID=A0A9W6PU97_9ACTN|nr:Scr1 family TA system antitoxin-like transcriptional regulator [Actinomadura rubrobrunea]GLW63712.1 transcriptional regulator [Actinomadura rubrobrunea]
MGEERLREIGRELRRLRTAAGLSGVRLAARAGVPQPTVSRVETGQRVSDPEVVLRLFAAFGLEGAEAERLAALVRDAYAETAARRVDAGASFRPGAAVELARSVAAVRVFGALVMPAPLRTAEYVAEAEVAAGGGAADWAALLGDEGRRFTFVVAEAVLRTWPGSGACMAGQFAHVLSVAERPNVRFGVVPGSAGAWPLVPLHGFTVLGDAAVAVETFTRELTLTDTAEVHRYAEIFERYERLAVFGDEARGLVERAAREVEEITRSIQ